MSEIIAGNSLRSQLPSAEIAGERAGSELPRILTESRSAYWRRYLSGAPVLTFPSNKARPAAPSGQFAAQSRRLAKALVEALRRISQDERVPFSLLLLAAFQVLLLRYTSQDDLVVGCVLGDTGMGREGSVRSRQNAYPLRVDLSDDPTFRDLLSRTYGTALEAIERGSFSLADWVEELTSELGVEAPTFQLSFSYAQNAPRSEQTPARIPSESGIPEVPVDLHLAIDDNGDEVSVRLLYAKELFDALDIDRALHNLETLLRAIAKDPDQRVSALPLLTEQEQRQIVVEWNQNIQDYPRDQCLHELIEGQAERTPERPAVVQGKRQLSYREFNERSNQLAHYLRSRGVGCGVTVGIRIEPTFEFAVAVIAVLKSGGACLPLDPKYPQERLNYMLQDSQARVLITHNEVSGSEVPAGCQTVALSNLAEALSAQPTTNTHSGATPNNIGYVLYTSGSTGKPRGVLLAHAGLVNYATAAARLYGIGPSDRMLQFCSISFDIAIEEMYTTWLSGAALVLRTEDMSLVVPEFLEWIEREKITVLDLPTAYWHEWVHHFSELKEPVPPSLRLVIVGGEKASAKSWAAWSKSVRGRVRWINTYGPTEASICVTAFEPAFEDSIPENIPVGRPFPNCRVYLLDRQLNPVPVGVPGELHVGGICVSKGYHNRPEMTSQKFIPDPFSNEPDARMYKTGDMARYLPSGDIEFLGRGDDQIKIRGFRVELGEIEAAMAKHPQVGEVAVVAREDAPGDKRLIAYVVPARNSEPTAIKLRHYLQQHLPDYMVPSDCVLLDAMPLTPNGKVDRRGLPAPQSTAVPSHEVVAASDAFQSKLVGIWEEVLGRKPIGIRDNFFELGGHSLLAARLMHRIGRTLNKTVPLALLFEAPTIEQLAATLRDDGWSRHWSSLVPIQPLGSHAPFFCIHGVGGNVVGFHELGRRMAPDFPFYGLQAQGLDGKHPCHTTIEEMASHYLHEIRSVQPRGPYFLGGFSFGGLVAYEMSQQLLAQGEETGLLVLFDTYPGDLKSVAESLVHLVLTPSWRNWTYDLPKALRKRINRLSRNWNLPQHLRDVRDTNRAASDRYLLQPFAGRATLIRADEQSLRSSSGDPHAAWNTLVSNLQVHSIPGNHYDILVEPQVEHLAECLKACISEASLSRVS
jgi:amino acid adenylation domain-containing protein